METRKITVVSTRTQSKRVINSNATTLGQLKNDLVNNSIDYSGLTFYEGLSRTELKDDASVLPTNVPYNGGTTNDLVFMLTNPDKHIASGIDRHEVYDLIKSHNLEEDVKENFGKPYTQCKTEDLMNLVSKACKKESPCCEDSGNNGKPIDTIGAIRALVETLLANGVIEDDDADNILAFISKEKCPETYSDDEISNMFSFLN